VQQYALMIAIALHVLAAASWAGTTFAMARLRGDGSERLFVPQMIAAAVAILSGGYLWRSLHQGTFETIERILGVGVACAFLALAVQVIVAGGALRKLRRQAGDGDAQRARIAIAHRVASALLAVSVMSMAAARFA
jgi:uncharacterized membrane protein